MVRYFVKTLMLMVLLGAGVGTLWYYQGRSTAERKVQELQQQNAQLTRVVSLLENRNRVAEVLVTDQTRSPDDKVLKTTLLFVEYDRSDRALPPKTFTIDGEFAHIDALVIKFNSDFVKQDDPLRGHSISLFNRLFGETQTPEEAFRIDEPGQIPAIYRDVNPVVREYQEELWQNFWRLARDEEYRKSKGVDVAFGQSSWGPFEPGKLYTLSIQADGGMEIKSEKLRGIYAEALKKQAEQSPSKATGPH